MRIIADVSTRKLATVCGVAERWQGVAEFSSEIILSYVPRRAIPAWHFLGESFCCGLSPAAPGFAKDREARATRVEAWTYGQGDRPPFLPR